MVRTFSFRTRFWMTRGSLDARYQVPIPPQYIHPPGEVWYGQTTERGIKGMMAVYCAEAAPLHRLSFEFQYGKSHPSGNYRIHSWIHAPDAAPLTNYLNGATWWRPDHEDDRLSEADNAGQTSWAAANVYFRVFQSRPSASDEESLSHSLDIAVGVERYHALIQTTNLRRILSLAKFYAPAPIGPIPGANMSNEVTWKGPHVGLREEIHAPHGLSVDGSFFWSPFMKYSADGFENLSVGAGLLRGKTPNFQDRADGTAVHFQAGLAWAWKLLRVEAGYQRLYFYSRTGTERYYNYDGTVTDTELNFATAELGGMYTGVSIRF